MYCSRSSSGTGSPVMQASTSRKVLTESAARGIVAAVVAAGQPLGAEDREAGVELVLGPVGERAVEVDVELRPVVAGDDDDRVRV